jgi:hypothetical protein
MQIHELHFPLHGDVSNMHPNPVASVMDPFYGPIWSGPVADSSLKGNPFSADMTLDFANAPQHDHFQTGAPMFIDTAKATVHLDWMPGPAGNFPPLEPAVPYFVSDPTAVFAGNYVISQAHIDFSFTSQVSLTDTTPYTFTSNPDGQRVLFAQVGHEVNGLFAQ